VFADNPLHIDLSVHTEPAEQSDVLHSLPRRDAKVTIEWPAVGALCVSCWMCATLDQSVVSCSSSAECIIHLPSSLAERLLEIPLLFLSLQVDTGQDPYVAVQSRLVRRHVQCRCVHL